MILIGWRGHTDRSRQLALIVRASIDALGWTDAYACQLLGISAAQLSRQLNGVEPFNLWRLAELPDEFQAEYDARRAALRGAVVWEANHIDLIRSYSNMPRHQMAYMTRVELPLGQKKERAS